MCTCTTDREYARAGAKYSVLARKIRIKARQMPSQRDIIIALHNSSKYKQSINQVRLIGIDLCQLTRVSHCARDTAKEREFDSSE